jgi:Cu-Zn family superoxide dismutase
MLSTQRTNYFAYCLMQRRPSAQAAVRGGSTYPDIIGNVYFYAVSGGVFVAAEVIGLPYQRDDCGGRIFGFHIHEGESCTGNGENPFSDTGGHYNPRNCPHPGHAGDLPPLFGNNGYAWAAFFTNRFGIREITGKTIVIHNNPDDFKTQPSGGSGERIACGVIR